MKKLIGTLFIALILFGCNNQNKNTNEKKNDISLNSIIYYNGDIITMSGDKPEYVEAVVQQNGIIVFTGNQKDAFEKYENESQKFDLKGQTMLPGFIEPHVHPSIAATILPNDIVAPYDWVLPTGTKKGIEGEGAYREAIKKSIDANAKEESLYFIWGYHQLWHGELNRTILNELAPDLPACYLHRSFHEIFLNDKAIALMNIQESDYVNNKQVDWQKGHFYEGGFLALMPRVGHLFMSEAPYLKGLDLMSQLVLKNGITTIAEPGFPSVDFNIEYNYLKTEMDKNKFYDVYLVPNGTQLYAMKGNSNEAVKEFAESLPKTYNTTNIEFLPNQIKLFADGAIYSQLMQMKDGYTDGHQGEWMTPLDLYEEQVKFYWDSNYKIHIHANGDLGIQMAIDVIAKMQTQNPRENHQTTLHHMGYFTDEMAEQMSTLKIEASVNPYYLWALADKYSEKGLGKERAENLVAIESLVKRGIPVSFHSDFAMAPIEPLTLAWAAINRVTSQNRAVSQDQRISVFDGLKGITTYAARTLSLENQIGTIENGKKANFTILKENPLKVEPIKIKDIPIYGIVFKGNFKQINNI